MIFVDLTGNFSWNRIGDSSMNETEETRLNYLIFSRLCIYVERFPISDFGFINRIRVPIKYEFNDRKLTEDYYPDWRLNVL